MSPNDQNWHAEYFKMIKTFSILNDIILSVYFFHYYQVYAINGYLQRNSVSNPERVAKSR